MEVSPRASGRSGRAPSALRGTFAPACVEASGIDGTDVTTLIFTDPSPCYTNNKPKLGQVCTFHGRGGLAYLVAPGNNRLRLWLEAFKAGTQSAKPLVIKSHAPASVDKKGKAHPERAELNAFFNASLTSIEKLPTPGGYPPGLSYWEIHFTYQDYQWAFH